MSAPPQPNRLIHETSPYLLQHARNPVDWFPWRDEAFAEARRLDRPIFLSVGYSACHWCHVMEHECFENPAIAARMNEWFVNIKVDREERPDVDQIYMAAVQLVTRRGGWPMSVFMTPAGKPFYAGTYFPPESRHGMISFPDLLARLHDFWINRRDECESSSDELVAAIRGMTEETSERGLPAASLLTTTAERLVRATDMRHGGLGTAPKFPHPMDLRVMLRAQARTSAPAMLDAAILTLRKMAAGGIYDHLGGGFARYSTDERWLVPHFEKMLYDNALLTPAYWEAAQITQDSSLAETAIDTIDYVLREMTSPEGLFFATQDADSEGEEGKFYVWTQAEIMAVLGPERGQRFAHCFDVSSGGNWEGHNILHRPLPLRECATALQIDPGELQRQLQEDRQKLFAVRSQRVWPARDDKVIAAWNGLMLSALSMVARGLPESERGTRYVAALTAAATAIETRLVASTGRLWHSFKDGQATIPAFLDDYACLIDGFVETFLTTGDERWLARAEQLAADLREFFWDDDAHLFRMTASDHEALIARPFDRQDNATPSGNNMAATALYKLGLLTARTDLTAMTEQVLAALGSDMSSSGMGMGQALMAFDLLTGPTFEVRFSGGTADDQLAIRQWLAGHFRPRWLAIHTASRPMVPHEEPAEPEAGPLLLWICEAGSCRPALIGKEAALKGLEALPG